MGVRSINDESLIYMTGLPSNTEDDSLIYMTGVQSNTEDNGPIYIWKDT